MLFAKVLFGKEAGLSKCTRVDSLGLAKRRLAAKAAQEELVIEEPDAVDEPAGAGTSDADALPQGQDPDGEDEQDDAENVLKVLGNRQHRDSLRIHRRRLRQRASLELPPTRFQQAVRAKGTSWSSGNSHMGDGGEDEDDENDEVSAGARHVRFRRASDGEYLTPHTDRSLEAGLPNALKAVQLKAERLFRRLTAPFAEHPTRPRSATPSRGASPGRSQRTSTSRPGSTSRSSASWALGLRPRSIDAGVASACSPTANSPSAAAVAAAAALATAAATTPGPDTSEGRSSAGAVRAKRKSAPGELFFPVVGGGGGGAGGRVEAGTPPSQAASGAYREAGGSGAGATPGGGLSKGRNWLARLSRGFSVAGGSSPGGGKGLSQAPPSPPPSSSQAAVAAAETAVPAVTPAVAAAAVQPSAVTAAAGAATTKSVEGCSPAPGECGGASPPAEVPPLAATAPGAGARDASTGGSSDGTAADGVGRSVDTEAEWSPSGGDAEAGRGEGTDCAQPDAPAAEGAASVEAA